MGISYEPFYGAREVSRDTDKQEELKKAFLKFCKRLTRPSFVREMRRWIGVRLDSGFQVDPDDPELKEPSEEFRKVLLAAFNQEFKHENVADSKPPRQKAKKR